MDITPLISIGAAFIVSAGGVGGITIAIIKFSANTIADKLSAKYENKLEKALEKYKTELGKKEYVSKTRFDAEFGIYRELSATFCTMVKDINVLIPAGFNWQPAGEEARKKYEDECYKTANNSTVKAQDSLYASAAFIPEDFFKGYEELLLLCKRQLNTFAFRYNALSLMTEEEKYSLSQDDYRRTDEINEKWRKHNSIIREYLATLDVL